MAIDLHPSKSRLPFGGMYEARYNCLATNMSRYVFERFGEITGTIATVIWSKRTSNFEPAVCFATADMPLAYRYPSKGKMGSYLVELSSEGHRVQLQTP
jgi:hypothetical protein